eukprot:2644672-Pleurochrysis_carterae.AAC.7
MKNTGGQGDGQYRRARDEAYRRAKNELPRGIQSCWIDRGSSAKLRQTRVAVGPTSAGQTRVVEGREESAQTRVRKWARKQGRRASAPSKSSMQRVREDRSNRKSGG